MTTSVTLVPPINQTNETDYISICEFLWNESVAIKQGTVFFSVPNEMVGKNIKAIHLGVGSSGSVSTTGQITLDVVFLHVLNNSELLKITSTFNFDPSNNVIRYELPSTQIIPDSSKLRINTIDVIGSISGLSCTLVIE